MIKKNKLKLLFVFGTRPESIKLSPLILEFKKYQSKVSVEICVTAQHREMLDTILSLFKIKPDYDLNIMKSNQDLVYLSKEILTKVSSIISNVNPDIVFVQGDTTTAFFAALAAFYQNIKIAHIEAGLRTNNLLAPFPEEANRRFISVLSDYNFAPTKEAYKNLKKENIDSQKIFITGNTVIDALFQTVKYIRKNSKNILNKFYRENIFPKKINFSKKIILVTGHRRESFGSGFLNICSAIKEIAERFPDFQIVYPVHRNPNVREPVYKILGNTENIILIDALSYLPFVYLMDKSYLILTDSGGIQEEAPSLGKPVLVMRDKTERSEGLKAGTLRLVGTDKCRIVKETVKLLTSEFEYKKMSGTINPFGDGRASQKIVKIILKKFELF